MSSTAATPAMQTHAPGFKREWERFELSGCVVMLDPVSKRPFKAGRLIDISAGGLCCYLPLEFAKGQFVTLSVKVDGIVEFTTKACVQWVASMKIGVEYVQITSDLRTTIDRALRSKSKATT